MNIAQVGTGHHAAMDAPRRSNNAAGSPAFGSILDRTDAPRRADAAETRANDREDERRADREDEEGLVDLLGQMQTIAPTARRPAAAHGLASLSRISREKGAALPDRQVLAAPEVQPVRGEHAVEGAGGLTGRLPHLVDGKAPVLPIIPDETGEGGAAPIVEAATPGLVDALDPAMLGIAVAPILPQAPPAAIEGGGRVPVTAPAPLPAIAVPDATPLPGVTPPAPPTIPAQGGAAPAITPDLSEGVTQDGAEPGAPAAAVPPPVFAPTPRPDAVAPAAAFLLGSSLLGDDAAMDRDALSISSDQPIVPPAPIAPGMARAAIDVAKIDTPSPIDAARGDWLEAMVERVAELRDIAGSAKSTLIRLSPDALGAIDVRIDRGANGTTQVSFASDNPQARAMLAEAAPRLVEMAEARGLRFEQANVGGGQAGAQQSPSHGQPHPRAPQPDAPLSSEAADARPANAAMRAERIA